MTVRPQSTYTTPHLQGPDRGYPAFFGQLMKKIRYWSRNPHRKKSATGPCHQPVYVVHITTTYVWDQFYYIGFDSRKDREEKETYKMLVGEYLRKTPIWIPREKREDTNKVDIRWLEISSTLWPLYSNYSYLSRLHTEAHPCKFRASTRTHNNFTLIYDSTYYNSTLVGHQKAII